MIDYIQKSHTTVNDDTMHIVTSTTSSCTASCDMASHEEYAQLT